MKREIDTICNLFINVEQLKKNDAELASMLYLLQYQYNIPRNILTLIPHGIPLHLDGPVPYNLTVIYLPIDIGINNKYSFEFVTKYFIFYTNLLERKFNRNQLIKILKKNNISDHVPRYLQESYENKKLTKLEKAYRIVRLYRYAIYHNILIKKIKMYEDLFYYKN